MAADKYLKDESPYTGSCERAAVVKCEEDVYVFLQEGGPVTVRGSGTGLAGSCVPAGGSVLDMSGLAGFIDMEPDGQDMLFTFYAGTTLDDAGAEIRRRAPGYFLPQDPTEGTATLGGLYSMDASGPGCFRYGTFKTCVEAVDAVDAGGNRLHLKKGNGDNTEAPAGAEGSLFVITSLTVRAVPEPPERSILIIFFGSEGAALDMMDGLLSEHENGGMASLTAVDYMDAGALKALTEHEEESGNVFAVPEGARAAVYLELRGDPDTEEDLETVLVSMEEAGDTKDDWAWAGTSEIENRRLSEFRHKVQEAVNLKRIKVSREAGTVLPLIGLGRKDGTRDIVEFLRERFAEDDAAIIAHYGSGEVYAAFFTGGADLSGASERGIVRSHGYGYGKMPADIPGLDRPDASESKELKKRFDPEGRFNPGNFPEI